MKYRKDGVPMNHSFCTGPVRTPYFLPGVDLTRKDLFQHPEWVNPKWLPANGDFCEHGFQYSHYSPKRRSRVSA